MALKSTNYRKEYVSSVLRDSIPKDIRNIITTYIYDDRLELMDNLRCLIKSIISEDTAYTVNTEENIILIHYPSSFINEQEHYNVICTIYVQILDKYKITGYLDSGKYGGIMLSNFYGVDIHNWLRDYITGVSTDDIQGLIRGIISIINYYKQHLQEPVKNDSNHNIDGN